MHWTLILMYAVMLLWLAPAMLWRHSAAVLLASWFVGQIAYWVTGDPLPITVYIFVDIIAFILILRSAVNWLDYSILVAFPAMWLAYYAMDGAQLWWTLYYLALTQFLLAGPWPVFQKIRGFSDHGPVRKIKWS